MLQTHLTILIFFKQYYQWLENFYWIKLMINLIDGTINNVMLECFSINLNVSLI